MKVAEQGRLDLKVSEVPNETPLIRAIRLARLYDEPSLPWDVAT